MVAPVGIRSNQLLSELVNIYKGLRAIEEIVGVWMGPDGRLILPEIHTYGGDGPEGRRDAEDGRA